jgi:hypothetical protein
MKLNNKYLKIIKWFTRIFALAVILFGLPFYFGYGNPLPFIHPGYTLFDNMWLTIFPLMFIGLGLGWKYEKIGGYLVSIPIIIGLSLSLIMKQGMIFFMLVPLIIGILFLLVGYSKSDSK